MKRIWKLRDVANLLMERWDDQEYVDAALWLEEQDSLPECEKHDSFIRRNYRGMELDDIAQYIMEVICWSDSPQGSVFWDDFYSDVCDGRI